MRPGFHVVPKLPALSPNIPRRLFLASLGVSVLALTACSRTSSPAFNGIDLTDATFGKDFSLTDADGHPRTLADYRGKVVMMFFGFTQCPDVCPTSLVRAAEIRKLLGEDGERLQVLFVTVDPERDTPEVLKAYAAAFDPSFVGLSGDLQRTKETAEAFRVYYAKVPTGSSYTMDHTSLTYVFDPKGRLRLALRHEQNAQECAADLKTLLAGQGES